MDCTQYFQMLPGKIAEMQQAILTLQEQLVQAQTRVSECAAAEDELRTLRPLYDEAVRSHQDASEARDSAQRDLMELRASHELALKQRDAANSRRDALGQVVEADRLELEAQRLEIDQLKAKLSHLEGGSRPSGSQNAVQRQPATVNPALLMLKPDPTTAGAPSAKPNGLPAPEDIPEIWAAQLTGLPTVEAPAEAMTTSFSRSFLSAQLGGGTQGVVMRVSAANDKVRLKQFNITRYYCPNAQGNPWLPKLPGMHGFMFVGMGTLDSTVGAGECCEMFIGMGTNDWRYFGTYKCTRMEPLAVKDFKDLTPAMQNTYCKFTVAKQLTSTVSDAMSKYSSGELRVPCVRLACQGFDQALFDSLRANFRAAVSAPQVTPSPSAKRQRQVSLSTPTSAALESPSGSSRRASGRLREKGPVSYADGDDDEVTMVEDQPAEESPSAKRPRLDGPGWTLMLHPPS